jgi:hypothetical protein
MLKSWFWRKYQKIYWILKSCDAIAERLMAPTYQLIQKLISRLLSLPAKIALGCLSLPLIEEKILYPRYEKALLNSIDANIVDRLTQTGIYITSLECLNIPHTSEFFEAAKQLSEDIFKIVCDPLNRGKHTIPATSAELINYPEVFRWGLDERLLKIVERYLGLPVAYNGASCTWSIADGREAGPRLWHRDWEDRHEIKICVYLNEVNEEGGPFQCVQSNVNSLLYNSSKHPYIYKNLCDRTFKELIPKSLWNSLTTCTGQASTVIFVDTGYYHHRGKPPTQLNRSAIWLSYFSRHPRHPFLCEQPFSQEDLHQLTQGLTAAQKACVHWRNNLPGWVRWIPENRVRV